MMSARDNLDEKRIRRMVYAYLFGTSETEVQRLRDMAARAAEPADALAMILLGDLNPDEYNVTDVEQEQVGDGTTDPCLPCTFVQRNFFLWLISHEIMRVLLHGEVHPQDLPEEVWQRIEKAGQWPVRLFPSIDSFPSFKTRWYDVNVWFWARMWKAHPDLVERMKRGYTNFDWYPANHPDGLLVAEGLVTAILYGWITFETNGGERVNFLCAYQRFIANVSNRTCPTVRRVMDVMGLEFDSLIEPHLQLLAVCSLDAAYHLGKKHIPLQINWDPNLADMWVRGVVASVPILDRAEDLRRWQQASSFEAPVLRFALWLGHNRPEDRGPNPQDPFGSAINLFDSAVGMSEPPHTPTMIQALAYCFAVRET